MPVDVSSLSKLTQDLDTWIPKQIRPNRDSEDYNAEMAQGSDSPPCSDVFFEDSALLLKMLIFSRIVKVWRLF